MAKALGEHKCYTCIHKFYSLDAWKEFAASNKAILPYVAASSGNYHKILLYLINIIIVVI